MRTRTWLPLWSWLLVLLAPGAAHAAKWTVGVILVGQYEDMEKRVRTTGASDDVNVILLHYRAANDAVAYRLLKDPNTTHPKGQCCPGDETVCCDIETIPLATIGIDSTVSAASVTKFYQFLAKAYPAEHYLLGLRGDPLPTRVLVSHDFTDGITIVELNAALQALVDARGGKKIEVLVAGFCESGALDWAYALAKTVDYYVGTPNFSNPPVATRWRVYRWAREVIEKPSITARKLASRVVDLFALTTTDCVDNNNGCSNAPAEPWTAVAIETAKLPAVATAVKDAVCALMPLVTPALHKSVLEATTLYCSLMTPRYDMASYFLTLKDKLTDTAAKVAIDQVLAAHDASVVAWQYEANSYSGRAFGYSFFVMPNLGPVAEVGSWQVDSLWQAYIGKVTASSASSATSTLPSATGLVVDPPAVALRIGEQRSVTARGSSAKFPSMCQEPTASWSMSGLDGVASLDKTSGAPVMLTGLGIGTGTLVASASSRTAQATVTVTDGGASTAPTPQSDAGTPADETKPSPDAGTDVGHHASTPAPSCAAIPGIESLGAFAAALALASRRRRTAAR